MRWCILDTVAVVERSGYKRNHYKVCCKYCGGIKLIRINEIQIDNKCKRCTLIQRNKIDLAKINKCGEIPVGFLGIFKLRAKRRGVLFDITPEYAWSIWTGYCAISNLPIELPTKRRKDGSFEINYNTPSLDRIDSNLPYIEGNVQWVNKYINIMKNGLPQEEFIYLCQQVAHNHANQQPSVLKGNRKVNTTAQRLEGEDVPTNNPSTSAQHLKNFK